MIKTGIDIVEIERFSKMENLDTFIKRVFTREESQYFTQKKNSFESIAGFFAAKEAFSKFMGTGFRGFGFKDIEVFHDALGKPHIKFMGNPVDVDLSISHSDTVAAAVVCGEAPVMKGTKAELIKSYKALLPKRHSDMHKGDCGRLFILAGSLGMTGAAVLTALGALRSGCGLVTVGTPKSQQPVLAVKLTEAMTTALSENDGFIAEESYSDVLDKVSHSDACVIGPGLGKTKNLTKLIEDISPTDCRLLIDADGINALSENINILTQNHNDIVLTPHPGEMSRLTGLSIEEIQSNREAVAVQFAKKYNVTLLLKGKDTVVASPRGEIHINPTGNSGMATGGMGDVLSGIIGSFMAQGLDGYKSAILGAFVHGLAGDLAAEELGEFGLIATDLVDAVPKAILGILKV